MITWGRERERERKGENEREPKPAYGGDDRKSPAPIKANNAAGTLKFLEIAPTTVSGVILNVTLLASLLSWSFCILAWITRALSILL